MSRSIKTLALVAVVLVAAVASAGAALAVADGPQLEQAEESDSSTETITVSANGEAQAQPDAAVLRIAVEAQDADVTEARSSVAADVEDIESALADLGVEDAQIRTTDYRIYEDRRAPERKDTDETQYRVRHVLTIDVDDTDQVGSAIDAAVDAGATRVHDVRFTLEPETRQELRNEALENAMSDASSQADTIATSADLEIDGVASVDTVDRRSPSPVYAMEAAAGDSASTSIDSGPVSVSAQVTVTYNASG